MLVNVWYPARPAAGTTPMPHGGYLEILPGDARFDPLAAALVAHAREILVLEIFGTSEDELDEEGRSELGRLLASPTTSYRDAIPADGPFPLVVYHSGAGSSYEDNAAFCEYLAGHGYVVAGSAYLEADGASLGIDAGRGSAGDFQFLVRHAGTQLPFVDASRVAVGGHSAGAQATLRYASHPGCAADVLLLLDTTQDYYGLAIPIYETLVEEVTKGIAHLRRPMLFTTGPEASFRLADTLVHAERTYLTVPALGHNEYIAQGIQRLERIARTAGDAPGPEDAKELARRPDVLGQYVALCEFVRRFLDAHLLDEGEAPDASDADALAVQVVPVGVEGPPPYDPRGDVAPTPRQLWTLADALGVEGTIAVLERFRETDPEHPMYDSTMLTGSVVYELFVAGREDEARVLYRWFSAVPLDLRGFFGFLATISEMMQWSDRARHFLEVALELDPEASEIAERLRAMD